MSWHHDDDSSFQSVVKDYAQEQGWKDTDTGGYNPNGNALAERRIGSLNMLVRVYLLVATGGDRYISLLWGVAMKHANFILNVMPWSDRPAPYTSATSEVHPRIADLHPFGAYCLYRMPREKKSSKFQPNSRMGVWIGVSEASVTPKKIPSEPVQKVF